MSSNLPRHPLESVNKNHQFKSTNHGRRSNGSSTNRKVKEYDSMNLTEVGSSQNGSEKKTTSSNLPQHTVSYSAVTTNQSAVHRNVTTGSIFLSEPATSRKSKSISDFNSTTSSSFELITSTVPPTNSTQPPVISSTAPSVTSSASSIPIATLSTTSSTSTPLEAPSSTPSISTDTPTPSVTPPESSVTTENPPPTTENPPPPPSFVTITSTTTLAIEHPSIIGELSSALSLLGSETSTFIPIVLPTLASSSLSPSTSRSSAEIPLSSQATTVSTASPAAFITSIRPTSISSSFSAAMISATSSISSSYNSTLPIHSSNGQNLSQASLTKIVAPSILVPLFLLLLLLLCYRRRRNNKANSPNRLSGGSFTSFGGGTSFAGGRGVTNLSRGIAHDRRALPERPVDTPGLSEFSRNSFEDVGLNDEAGDSEPRTRWGRRSLNAVLSIFIINKPLPPIQDMKEKEKIEPYGRSTSSFGQNFEDSNDFSDDLTVSIEPHNKISTITTTPFDLNQISNTRTGYVPSSRPYQSPELLDSYLHDPFSAQVSNSIKIISTVGAVGGGVRRGSIQSIQSGSGLDSGLEYSGDDGLSNVTEESAFEIHRREEISIDGHRDSGRSIYPASPPASRSHFHPDSRQFEDRQSSVMGEEFRF